MGASWSSFDQTLVCGAALWASAGFCAIVHASGTFIISEHPDSAARRAGSFHAGGRWVYPVDASRIQMAIRIRTSIARRFEKELPDAPSLWHVFLNLLGPDGVCLLARVATPARSHVLEGQANCRHVLRGATQQRLALEESAGVGAIRREGFLPQQTPRQR